PAGSRILNSLQAGPRLGTPSSRRRPGGSMVSDSFSFFDPGRLSRRAFFSRSLSAGISVAAASMTWEALMARYALAAPASGELPEVSTFLSGDQVAEVLKLALSRGGEFAEVYGEYTINTGIRLDESKIKSLEYGILSGVGVRVVSGEAVGYAYADSYDM